MKLRAQDDSGQLDIELRSDDGPDSFTVVVSDGSGPSEELAVRVLSVDGDRWCIDMDGAIHDLLIEETADGITVAATSWGHSLQIGSSKDRIGAVPGALQAEGPTAVKARMPGKVVRVLKEAGDEVSAGDGIVIVEAMKMQNEICAPRDGTLVACSVVTGQSVASGDLLFEID